jgi:parallel beta-helix repeat protein
MAAAVECGEVLTEDTVLEADLLNCPGDGLIVGTDGILIDLAGHTIRGRGGFHPPIPGSAGIRNPGHGSVGIRNGRIEGFETGVELIGVSQNRVEALSIDTISDSYALRMVESIENEIYNNILDCTCDANLTLIDSNRNRIERNFSGYNDDGDGYRLIRSTYNELIGNEFYGDQDGLVLTNSDHNIIQENTLRSGFDFALRMRDSHHNEVIRNSADRTYDGISLRGGHRNVISGNWIGGKDLSLEVYGDSNRIVGNQIRSSSHEFATAMISGNRNQVTGNVIIGFKRRADCFQGQRPPAGFHVKAGSGNKLVLNVVADHCFDGVLVEDIASKTLLQQNYVTNSTDDGLDVRDPTAVLVGNESLGNADYGIEAVPGVRGGGNQASGNGNPDQCVNVACK